MIVVDQIQAAIRGGKRVLADAQERRPILDHLVRAAQRFSADRGNQLAAAITLPGFLSFFPLVALALSIAGFVAHYDTHAQDQITSAISGFFPGLIGSGKGQINVTSIANQRTTTGVVGLVGLLLGGLGWVSAMRSTLRIAWHQPQLKRNFVIAKLLDILALAGIGVAVLVSLVITALATSAAHLILDHTPLPDSGGTEIVLRILAIALAIGGDVLLFGFLYLRLAEPGGRFRHIASGALFGAIGFEILKSVGATYIAHTTHNPLYASFAVVIGLLAWTNLVARLFLFAAVWAVTAPYASDVPPSGSAVTVDVSADGAGTTRRERRPATAPPRLVPAANAALPDVRAPDSSRVPGWAAARIAGSTVLMVGVGTAALVGRHAWRTVRGMLD